MAGGSTGSSPFQSTSANVAPREIGNNFAGSELFPPSDNDQAAMGLYEQALKTSTSRETRPSRETVNHLTGAFEHTVSSVGLNAPLSGVLYNGPERRAEQQLDQTRNTLSEIFQKPYEPSAPQASATTQSSERAAVVAHDQKYEEILLRRIAMITKESSKPGVTASGREQLINTHTNQRNVSQDRSIVSLVGKVYRLIKLDSKRTSDMARTIYTGKMAKKRSMMGGNEANMDKSQKASVDIQRHAPHELTAGE